MTEFSFFYQSLKPSIQTLFGLSRDAIHMHIGFILYLLSFLVFKRKLNDWRLLIPGLVFSVFLEFIDMLSDLPINRFYTWHYLHDIMNTNLIPISLVLILNWKKYEKNS